MNREDSKLRTYKEFKQEVQLENYLLTIKDITKRKQFRRLRISSHQLHIETGRHRKPRKTPVDERICRLCNLNVVEDEKHFIMVCPLYNSERKLLIDKLNSFTNFCNLTENEQFVFIMSCLNGDYEVICKVIEFINKCTELRQETLQSL